MLPHKVLREETPEIILIIKACSNNILPEIRNVGQRNNFGDIVMQYRLVDKGNYNLKDHYILVTIITHTNQKTYVRSEVCRQEVTQAGPGGWSLCSSRL